MTSSRAATRGMEILRIGGGRRDDGVVARRQRDDQRRHRFRQHVLVGRALGDQHLAETPAELGRSLRGPGGNPLPATRT